MSDAGALFLRDSRLYVTMRPSVQAFNLESFDLLIPWEAALRGTLSALQLLAAFFLSILGLAMAFRSADSGALFIGSLLGAMGLSFLALLGINLARRQ